jgi:hypothetical protein
MTDETYTAFLPRSAFIGSIIRNIVSAALAVVSVVAAVATSGCATITRGTSEILVIATDPAGAMATISTGQTCKTPCALEMRRNHDYHVSLEKPGYERVDTDVRSQISGAGAVAIAGNIVLGGLIGAGIDAATGGTKQLVPNPLSVNLVALSDLPNKISLEHSTANFLGAPQPVSHPNV